MGKRIWKAETQNGKALGSRLKIKAWGPRKDRAKPFRSMPLAFRFPILKPQRINGLHGGLENMAGDDGPTIALKGDGK